MHWFYAGSILENTFRGCYPRRNIEWRVSLSWCWTFNRNFSLGCRLLVANLGEYKMTEQLIKLKIDSLLKKLAGADMYLEKLP
jgi:hypothetical protein